MSDIKFNNLETERLILRKFKESDVDTFFNVYYVVGSLFIAAGLILMSIMVINLIAHFK